MVVLVPLAGGSGQARDIEDILREKGYITEEEYREVKRAQAAEAESPAPAPEAKAASVASPASPLSFAYKPGKGFTIGTPDGKNALTLGGRIQVRYTAADRDDAADESDFRIRRARLWVEGHLYDPKFRYGFQGDFADDFELRDAYLEFAPRQAGGAEGRAVQDPVQPPAAHVLGSSPVRRPLDHQRRVPLR